MWHADARSPASEGRDRTIGAMLAAFGEPSAGYRPETRYDARCDQGSDERRRERYAAAAGVNTAMQPCSAPSPDGLAGAGACVPGAAPAVVVVVLAGGTVVGGTVVGGTVATVEVVLVVVGVVVLVVVVLAVEGTVVVGTVVGGVVVGGVVPVVVGTVVVVVAAAGAPAPAVVAVSWTVVHAPAVWRVATSSTRRARSRFSAEVSDARVAWAWPRAAVAAARPDSAAATADAAACASVPAGRTR